jgi:transcriptional regulator with XRE-family HTH domain
VRFGERLRELRKAKNLSQRTLGNRVGVSFTYISRIENEKLEFGDYPSEELICKLAKALGVDEDELLILAEKIPGPIRKRFFERPDVFRALARCDDKTLDRVMAQIRRLDPASKKDGRSAH